MLAKATKLIAKGTRPKIAMGGGLSRSRTEGKCGALRGSLHRPVE
jgi:hypothetical protein